MTFDEFVGMLDKKNQYWELLASTFKDDHRKGVVIIERKGRDLVEVVQRCKGQNLYPVVDKKLGLVFGCETHGLPRTELFRYYYFAQNMMREYVDPNECEDRYISEGHGWFISKMRPDIVVAGLKYRPDQFDKDVFAMHQVESQDLNAIEELHRLSRFR